MVTSPLSIIGFEENSNLRHVTWNQRYLEEVKGEWKLKHGQAVVFCNKAQDRFRLVAVFYGLAVLVLPPIDPDERHSLYLKISEFLRKFEPRDNVAAKLEEEIELTKSRIERRRKLAAEAQQRRKA